MNGLIMFTTISFYAVTDTSAINKHGGQYNKIRKNIFGKYAYSEVSLVQIHISMVEYDKLQILRKCKLWFHDQKYAVL